MRWPSASVWPQGTGTLRGEDIADFVGSRRMLVLLDNCEHLLDAAADLVDQLLARCPTRLHSRDQPGSA